MIYCGLLLTLLAVLHSSVQAQEVANTEASPSIGSRAPDFNLAEVFGGSVKSDDFRGKVIVIDFLATWCPPCMEEIPNFNALSEKYKDKNVRVIGIALDSGTLDEVKQKLNEHQVRYPVFYGLEKTRTDFGINVFPATFVLTQDWTVQSKHLNLVPNKRRLIEKEIDSLLNKESTRLPR
jgi:thiol-disulfide isomerase/thioredoxin